LPFRITADIKIKLFRINSVIINPTLKENRKKLALKGIGGAKPGKLLKIHIPIRTYYPWNE
jgi:hypothetical protein